MAQLGRQILSSVRSTQSIQLPSQNVWQLPEKILQFGTGVLLRGLPDYYINKANNKGIFNGRVVVVKSTSGGNNNDAFELQNNLYTQCSKGIEENEAKEAYIINAAISRVINATDNWQTVLACAYNSLLQIIISNTTEVGIALQENDDINASPPQSFPGKLLSFLYERYKVFAEKENSGMVIIPTELLVDNGTKLKAIVLELARLNNLPQLFITWLEEANDWCNSLVDRIVPGALSEMDKNKLQTTFGFTDKLAIMSEPYNLWAIETESERVKQVLSFSAVDNNVIITTNIQKYRELKLRLLNATHTFGCAFAFLNGFDLVSEAMQNERFFKFMRELMFAEIIPCIVGNSILKEEAEAFANHVINRFQNPFIQHQWLSISVQYTNKMKQRCIPLIVQNYRSKQTSQTCAALGFAAYLLFMKPVVVKGDSYYGKRNNEEYLIQDKDAKVFYLLWQNDNVDEVVWQALADKDLWGEDLTLLPNFKGEVIIHLKQLLSGVALDKLVH
ncbi:MAG: tagaturonate reductase [Bacteroidota bacterium]|nr:tagaturonate reductase [Bacteroidota bacterium]